MCWALCDCVSLQECLLCVFFGEGDMGELTYIFVVVARMCCGSIAQDLSLCVL